MTEDQPQLPSPAADVLRDHLLLQVAEENAAMREDGIDRRLAAACDVMGSIDLHLVSGLVVSTSLDRSAIVKNSPHNKSFLVASLDDVPLPLSDFGRVMTCISGQGFGYSLHGSIILKVDEDDGNVNAKLLLSTDGNLEGGLRGFVAVQGKIQGHSEGDLVQLREGAGGEERFQFTTRNSVTFAPSYMSIVITTELSEALRAWYPQPTFDSFENFERLPMDPGDFIQFPPLPPSDESRLAIVTALSCPDSKMILLDENHQLKNKRFHLSKIKERLGSVEVTHSAGKIKLCLKEGAPIAVSALGSSWLIALDEMEDHFVAVNDLRSLQCSVSGIFLQPVSLGANLHIQSYSFMRTFGTGRIFGDFVEESIPDLRTEDFQDMLQRIFLGEKQLFPPTSKLKLTAVLLTLDSVRGALNVLSEKTATNVANA